MPREWTEKFECFIAHAVFEHLERPWIAAREIARILKPGGLFWISTHQTFPLHDYPGDFFRFSRDALRVIFEDAGLVVDLAEYDERCFIVASKTAVEPSYLTTWNETFPSFLLVSAIGHKP